MTCFGRPSLETDVEDFTDTRDTDEPSGKFGNRLDDVNTGGNAKEETRGYTSDPVRVISLLKTTISSSFRHRVLLQELIQMISKKGF